MFVVGHGGGSFSWVGAIAAGLVAYAVQALFLFPIAELEPVAWLLAGIVVTRAARDNEIVEIWLPRALQVALVPLSAVVLVAGAFDVVADRDAKRVLERVNATRIVADPARATRLRPDAVRYRLVAARAFEARGSISALDAALDQLDRARHVSPNDPIVRSERARLLLERARRTGNRHDRDVARATLERLRHDDPRNAQVLLRLGVARALDADDAGAERAWRTAEDLAPRSAAASTDLAVLYARHGRWHDAAAAARRALDRDPKSQLAGDVLRQARRAAAHGT
jgi:tetratricopeptide (TPR) repeat protein